MFSMHISHVEKEDDRIITISGDRVLVNNIRDAIKSSSQVWIKNIQEYTTTYADGQIRDSASFTIGLYNLRYRVNNKSIAQMLLEFVAENKITLPSRDQYLLQYWRLEADMINEDKSYRSRFPTNAQLTSSKTLNKILKRCDPAKLPDQKAMFGLIEHSKAMENKDHYLQPFLPYEYEIQEFLKQQGCAKKEEPRRVVDLYKFTVYLSKTSHSFWDQQVSGSKFKTATSTPAATSTTTSTASPLSKDVKKLGY
jgi:hypothetical protein